LVSHEKFEIELTILACFEDRAASTLLSRCSW